jgi:hypothetical protein
MATKIDANRAAELLTEFMERHRTAFGSGLSGVVLDLRQERLVDQLCRRLAKDPEQVEFSKELPGVRALFAARMALFQANAAGDPDATVISNPASSDDGIVAELFRKILADAKLPKNWDRKKFGDVQSGDSE